MKTFSFHCDSCGQTHVGSPSLGYSSPSYWEASANANGSFLTEDVCQIEGRDFFIRGVLEIPIHDAPDPFSWGVWVTQSQANFERYLETIRDSPERMTFGYLANRLPGYPDTLNLHTDVHWKGDGQRPWIALQKADHPLYRDWAQGISWKRAMELFLPCLHPTEFKT